MRQYDAHAGPGGTGRGMDSDAGDREPEEIRVEISTKFRVSKVAAELEAAGLQVTRVWTDEPADFALTLATKP